MTLAAGRLYDERTATEETKCRSQNHACMIRDAEDKPGDAKLELAVESVFGVVKTAGVEPASCKQPRLLAAP